MENLITNGEFSKSETYATVAKKVNNIDEAYWRKNGIKKEDLLTHALYTMVKTECEDGSKLLPEDIISSSNNAALNLTAERSFLQKDFEEHAENCTITAILTSIFNDRDLSEEGYHKFMPAGGCYTVIRNFALKYFYKNGSIGTIPFFIKSIMEKSWPATDTPRIFKTNHMLFTMTHELEKKICFNLYESVAPGIISVANACHGRYKRHSMALIGYESVVVNCVGVEPDGKKKSGRCRRFTYFRVFDGRQLEPVYIPSWDLGIYTHFAFVTSQPTDGKELETCQNLRTKSI